MTKFRRLPISGEVLRSCIGCDEVNAAGHIPVELIIVPLDKYEVVEIEDTSLLIREKQKESADDIRPQHA